MPTHTHASTLDTLPLAQDNPLPVSVCPLSAVSPSLPLSMFSPVSPPFLPSRAPASPDRCRRRSNPAGVRARSSLHSDAVRKAASDAVWSKLEALQSTSPSEASTVLVATLAFRQQGMHSPAKQAADVP